MPNGPRPGVRADAEQRTVSGLAATMTVIAMGLGYAIAIGDPIAFSANLQLITAGLQIPPAASTFIASLAALTMAATVLTAGALGDLYGMRRMYLGGLVGAIAFSALAAAAPTMPVLMIARAGVGVMLAFLIGLSLSITNAVFPPGRRAAAIAVYFGLGYAVATPLPAIVAALGQAWGWRACFVVVPILAAAGLVVTYLFVPETTRSARRLDLLGMVLFAVALLGLIYGVSRIQTGLNAVGLTAIAVGLAAGVGFVVQERRSPAPALDMRVFRSSRFNAAVTAGVMANVVLGGTLVLLAFYLATIRKEPAGVFSMLLIPATALAAVGAAAAGPATNRFGSRAVIISGLLAALAGLVLMRFYDLQTSRTVVFVTVALTLVGAAVVATPQSAIMMSSAPPGVGGAVSAVKSAVNEGAYSFGPALFAVVGVNLFLTDSVRELAAIGVTRTETREALRAARSGHGVQFIQSDEARTIVDQAPHNAVEAINTLSLVMAVGPIAAIVAVLWLIRPARTAAT